MNCVQERTFPNTPLDYLELIHDICVDYDGYRKAADLMDLIDEIREIAGEGYSRFKEA